MLLVAGVVVVVEVVVVEVVVDELVGAVAVTLAFELVGPAPGGSCLCSCWGCELEISVLDAMEGVLLLLLLKDWLAEAVVWGAWEALELPAPCWLRLA